MSVGEDVVGDVSESVPVGEGDGDGEIWVWFRV